jgi:formate/nitrite transporter FocA (FNT family)
MSCKKDIAIAMHSGAFVSVNMLPVFPGNIHGTGFFLSIAGHMSC